MRAKFAWQRDPMHLIGHLENVAKSRALSIGKEVFDGVVSRTPVRTGSLRASWRASIGAPDYSVVNSQDTKVPLPAPIFPLTSMPLYAKLYISNGQKYVMPIEYGWSSQAPQGMIRVTLASLGITVNVRG